MQPKPAKDEKAHLHDMLDSAKQAAGYMAGQTFEEFWDDPKTRDAVAMRLTIVGEAARHVSAATAATIPAVPFQQIRGMRNRIAHTDDKVDFKEVWKVVEQDLKPLISELEKYFHQQKAAHAPASRIRVTPTPRVQPGQPGQGPRMSM